MQKLSNQSQLIIAAICAIPFSIGLGMLVVFFFGFGFSGGPKNASGALLFLLPWIALILIPLLVPAFIGTNSTERSKNYTYFLYGFLGWVALSALISAPGFFLQTRESQKKIAQYEVQGQQRETQRKQLLGKWNVTYKGEIITIEFTEDDLRVQNSSRHVINTFFYRNTSSVFFEEGQFYLSSDDSNRLELTIRSTVPAEMAQGTAPNLPYFNFTGYITEFTTGQFVYSSIRSTDARVPTPTDQLVFTKMK